MKMKHILIFAMLLVHVISGTVAKVEDTLLLSNAQVYTVDEKRSWAEAVAIDGEGLISAVGSAADLRANFPEANVIDLGGRMVLPGFQDVHLHAIEAGITATYCEMPQFGDEADFTDALKDCVMGWDHGEWIMGAGVNMAGLLDSVADPLALIDAVTAERPTIILDDIGHGAWANSRALAAAGFDRLEQDPAGGMLIRQSDGRLSGVVLESLSQTLVDTAQPATGANIGFAYESLIGAMATLAENGITSVSDAGGYWPRGHERVWAMAENNNALTVRASNALYVYPNLPAGPQIKELTRRLTNDPEALVRFNQVKIYVDGVLTQATSALYEPYEETLGLENSEPTGFEYFPQEILFRYARELSRAGFQLHFHATGDRGAGLALDAIAQSDPKSGPHRITHLYMVDPKDLTRFAELNVVADLQVAPSSVADDYLQYLTTFIGDRAERILPLRSLHKSGATVTLSSDWDADELSPLVKLETVLTRHQEAAPDLATAIEMMTINPARLLNHADRTGSIEVGKFADLVVLDRNLFDIPPSSIATTKIAATLFQGTAIFDPEGIIDN